MLENKVAIVTGGSEGIGFGIASALASKGIRVYLVARTESKLEVARDKIQENGGKVEIRSANIMDLEEMKRVIRDVYDDNGRLDIFVNNAGTWKPQSLDTSFEEIEALINFTMMAPYELTHYLINEFKNKKDNDLSILTISSQAAIKVMGVGLGYGPGKMGLTSALFHLDEEMGIKGIENVRNYRLYPNTVATENIMDAIRKDEVQNPVKLEAVVDAALDLVLGNTPTRDMRIGYYPGRGIVRTHFSSDPEDFYNQSNTTEEIVDSNFTPKDLFK